MGERQTHKHLTASSVEPGDNTLIHGVLHEARDAPEVEPARKAKLSSLNCLRGNVQPERDLSNGASLDYKLEDLPFAFRQHARGRVIGALTDGVLCEAHKVAGIQLVQNPRLMCGKRLTGHSQFGGALPDATALAYRFQYPALR